MKACIAEAYTAFQLGIAAAVAVLGTAIAAGRLTLWWEEREAKIVGPPAEVEAAMVAIEQVEEQYPHLIPALREVARRLAAEKGEITSDDIHEACPIPAGVDGRIMSVAFHPRKDWERVRWQPSRRSINNKRPVAVWRLRQAA